jgi:hypothetical protein
MTWLFYWSGNKAEQVRCSVQASAYIHLFVLKPIFGIDIESEIYSNFDGLIST